MHIHSKVYDSPMPNGRRAQRYIQWNSPNPSPKLEAAKTNGINKFLKRSMTTANINCAKSSPASMHLPWMSPASINLAKMSPDSINLAKMSPSVRAKSYEWIEVDREVVEEAVEDNLVYINCSGLQYVITEETLSRFPGSLLGDPKERQALYSQKLDSLYIDRHRPCFESILQFYQTGKECPPPFIDSDIYQTEKVFYGLQDQESSDEVIEIKDSTPKDSSCLCFRDRRMILHNFLVNPAKRGFASLYQMTDILMIFLGTTLFVLESEDTFEDKFDLSKMSDAEINVWLFALKAMTILWFTVDIILRMASWPKFIDYWKNIMNVMDILSVLPFYIEVVQWACSSSSGVGHYGAFRALKLIRVVRVFKFLRHSKGLVLVLRAMAKARQELLMMLVCLFLFVITFGSIMFYLENDPLKIHQPPDGSGPSSGFSSILMSCWWVLVSITTVGYGDMYPVTMVGKLAGSLVLCLGVIMLALPMTIMVSKFNAEFERDQEESFESKY